MDAADVVVSADVPDSCDTHDGERDDDTRDDRDDDRPP